MELTAFQCWDLDADPGCEGAPAIIMTTAPSYAAELAAERWHAENDYVAEQRIRVAWDGGPPHDYLVRAETRMSFDAELIVAPGEVMPSLFRRARQGRR